MHIKQVIISGFRSFRSQSEIEPFSSKHNVIVGRNGSGKSNFFDAIQFVLLGPRFANLRPEDRQHLLHEGAGSSVMAAYVEIIFDNSDGRLSIDGDEVVLRRTIGHKKDEFFLNRKRVQKGEVTSLLESAGFSKSNPYYIVQQGKVANLCVMKDKDRLNLLKEVAGTTVYEERRSESLRIMQDTHQKQERIAEVLSYIEERLSELEKEKEELTEYEQLDKQRRALEFSLYDKELSKANEQLSQMEETRENERDRHQELHARLRAIQDEITVDEDNLVTLRAALDRLNARKAAKHSEMTVAINRRSSIEVELQETVASAKASEVEKVQLKKELVELEKLIKKCEADLSKVEPKYDDTNGRAIAAQQQLENVKYRMEALYGKQRRGRQFGSKKDRDAFLGSQIDELTKQVDSKNKLIQKLTAEIDKEEVRLNKDREILLKAGVENEARVTRCDELNQIIKAKTLHRNELQETRKNSWRELEVFQEKNQEAKAELEKGKQLLNVTLPRSISQGLVTVEKYVEEQNIEGYYGPLIDCFTLKNDAFRTAIETAAGNSLFHVIVENDEVASKLMKELERRKAGRLTFLPLNRIRVEAVQYPDSNDVRPLIDVALNFEARFEPAIRQVFGKKILARDIQVAAHFSKEFQLDAITKDGDLVNRKGGFEGGYHDERNSRINAVLKIREATQQLEELSNEEEKLKKESEKIDLKVNDVMRELQKLEAERDHLRVNGDQLSKELGNRNQLIKASATGLEQRRSGLVVLQKEVTLANQQIDDYKKEQQTPLLDKLDDKERAELNKLIDNEKKLQASIETLDNELVLVRTESQRLKAELTNNLLKRKDDIELQLKTSENATSASTRDFDSEIALLESEKDTIVSLISACKIEVDETDSLIDKKRSELTKLEKNIESRRNEEQDALNENTEATKMQDKLLNKRTMLMETVQQKQQMIRELGSLPRKELEDFKDLSEKQLLSKMKTVNEQLKKYSSVNRKALDQYVSFNEQRETLMSRNEELTRDNASIEELIESLDAQREEAILRTFRGVSKHFAEVFSELVPGGAGELVMRTAADDAEEDAAGEVKTTEVSLDKRSKPNLSAFHGVQVRVKFSGSGQQFDMQQLSGGQKALVALALIFAIQRCDPAPFYLFDEIDQALDANYRAGVARLIQKQVESEDAPAQFITTTFRNELVSVANKCYGIALLNKVSNIYPLEKQEAMNFVQNLMTEEGVGAVSTVPGYQERDENFDNNYNEEEGPEVDEDEEEEEAEEEDERLAEIDKDLADIDIGKAKASSSSSRRVVDPFSDDEEDDDDIDLFEISKGKKSKAKGKGKQSKTVKRKSRA